MKPHSYKRKIAEPWLRHISLAAETRPWARTVLERSVGHPTLHEFSLLGPLHQNADDFLCSLLGERWTQQRDAIFAEHLLVQHAITERSRVVDLRYPAHFTVEDHTALVLYAIVRVLEPQVVVETGVADGRSTATMLAAMNKTAVGALHSFEISRNVGALLESHNRWTLHVLDRGQSITTASSDIGHADVFLHDGDHSRAGQQADMVAARNLLGPTGLLLSDDTDWSYVFHDTCKELGLTPTFLLDTRKVFGAVWL